jgi:hypothetical protein
MTGAWRDHAASIQLSIAGLLDTVPGQRPQKLH